MHVESMQLASSPIAPVAIRPAPQVSAHGLAERFAATEDPANTDRAYCQRGPMSLAMSVKVFNTPSVANARPAQMDVLNGEELSDTGFSAGEWAMCA